MDALNGIRNEALYGMPYQLSLFWDSVGKVIIIKEGTIWGLTATC